MGLGRSGEQCCAYPLPGTSDHLTGDADGDEDEHEHDEHDDDEHVYDPVQTDNMHELVRWSNGTLQLVRSRDELKAFIKARKDDRRKVAAVLGIEGIHTCLRFSPSLELSVRLSLLHCMAGLHALDGNITNVDVFFDAGVRMMGLAHFFDNDLSGIYLSRSAHRACMLSLVAILTACRQRAREGEGRAYRFRARGGEAHGG